jgi:hypothetical protein
MKECEPLAAPTTYTRVDEDPETELEGPGIALDVTSFDVLFADVVVLDPIPKLNDSVEVGAASNVGVASSVVVASSVGVASNVSAASDVGAASGIVGRQSGEVLSQQMDPPVAASMAQVWVSVTQPISPPWQQLQSGSM